MMKSLLALALVFGVGSAIARELDNDGAVTNQDLRGTVVIRVDQRNNSVSVLQSQAQPQSAAEAQALAARGSFKSVPSSKVRSELDQESGASSWYWYCPSYNYNYGYLYWYGYSYQPAYIYSYGYYHYYYYNRWTWNW